MQIPMKNPDLSWETRFDTARQTMTHAFGGRVEVITDLGAGEVVLVRNAVPFGRFPFGDAYTLDEHERFLRAVARWVSDEESR